MAFEEEFNVKTYEVASKDEMVPDALTTDQSK